MKLVFLLNLIIKTSNKSVRGKSAPPLSPDTIQLDLPPDIIRVKIERLLGVKCSPWCVSSLPNGFRQWKNTGQVTSCWTFYFLLWKFCSQFKSLYPFQKFLSFILFFLNFEVLLKWPHAKNLHPISQLRNYWLYQPGGTLSQNYREPLRPPREPFWPSGP